MIRLVWFKLNERRRIAEITVCLCVLFQLSGARVEVTQLQEQCKQQEEMIDRLRTELQNTVDEYATLSYQSRTVSHSYNRLWTLLDY